MQEQTTSCMCYAVSLNKPLSPIISWIQAPMKAGQHKKKKPAAGGRHKRPTSGKPRNSAKNGKPKQGAAAAGMKRKEPEAPVKASLGALSRFWKASCPLLNY